MMLTHMRIWTCICWLALSLLGCHMLSACVISAPDQHLIWRLEKGDVNFWVIGVSRYVLESDAALPAAMMDIYAQSEKIAPESIEGASKPHQRALAEPARQAAKGIFDALAEDKFLSFDAAFQLSQMDTYEWITEMDRILAATQKQNPRIQFGNGYDAYFARKALIEKTKLLIPLEQRERHPESWRMHCGSDDAHLKLLQAIDAQLRRPIDLSQRRLDFQKIAFKGDTQAGSQFYDALRKQDALMDMQFICSIIPRSKEWAQNIAKQALEYHKAMILVGAHHVIGQDNFIALLEQQGFKATRVKVESK